MILDCAQSRLPNGIRVATTRMPGVESVAIGIWVGVGGRYEEPRISGVSHFIEHLLFKGTKTRTARDISQAIEGRGGYFNAFTQEEATCYYARITAEHMADVLDILADMYLNPRFDRADIDKERGVIIEEISMYKDQPQQLVAEMLGELVWLDHPLGRPLIGTEKTVGHIRRRDILDYKARKYVPENTVVVFAGKVDHEACVRKIRQLLGSVRGGRKPVFSPVSRSVRQENVAVLAKDIEQTHIDMGVRLFGRHDSRRYALKLMSIVLGENMSSRLFQVVREKHGLAYSIHSGAQLFAETGLLDIQAGVDRDRVGKALELIVNELARLKDQPVGARELRRAKDYAIGQLRIGMESTSSQMMWVGESLLNYDRLVQPQEAIRGIEKVAAADVHRLANEVLSGRRLSVAMITPKGNDDTARMIREQIAALD